MSDASDEQQRRPAVTARPQAQTFASTARTNPIVAMSMGASSGLILPAPGAVAASAVAQTGESVFSRTGAINQKSVDEAYERRRSVYEVSVPPQAQAPNGAHHYHSSESLPVHFEATRSNSDSSLVTGGGGGGPVIGPSLISVRAEPAAVVVAAERQQQQQQRPSDFSLDEILANIESGHLAQLNSQATASELNRVAPIEMQDFSLKPGGNGGGPMASLVDQRAIATTVDVSRRSSHSAKSVKSSSEDRRRGCKASGSSSSSTSLSTADLVSSLSLMEQQSRKLGASSSTSSPEQQQRLDTDHKEEDNGGGGGDDDDEQRARRRSRDATVRRQEIAHGFEIAWLNFTYSVEPNLLEDPRWGRVNKMFHKERRMILKGLSGGLKSGQMVALMGPSGAGKTCLLESISGVRTSGIGGRMCLRGRKRAQLVIVPQYDDFMPQFSVEETIVYGSRMKNLPSANHKKVANKVMKELGLEVCRHNNIQRCSGGQRKRVAIAQELVSRPNILILDEPTSGLDSSCCYQTMKVLRDVLDQSAQTDEPMAIVSTIHQPSAKVFQMFDLIYLLGKTGYMAYSGPPDELLPTIGDVTGLECPTYSNPSDFMIELVAYDYGEMPVEQLIEFEREKAAQYVRDFEKRAGLSASTMSSSGGRQQAQQQESSLTYSSQVKNSRNNNNKGGALVSSKSDTHLVGTSARRLDQIQQRLRANDLLNGVAHVIYKNNVTVPLRRATNTTNRSHPFLWHTWVHLHRSFLQAIRDPILNNMRILIHLGFATLLVLLYGKKSGEARGCPPVLGLPQEITDPRHESMIDLADNVGYIFMCIMMITYVSLMSTVLTFPIDIKTVGKEYKNGWYGTVTYFLGKTIADLPFIVLYPVVYCLITWFLTNQAQDHWWRYASFTGLIIMNAMNSQSFGLILGALFVNSVTAATFLGPVMTIPWYLFTGFTKRAHRLSEPFKTASKFLFTRYIFEGILDTVYGHQRCNCSEFLQEYYELRYEEANRLGQLVSVETLSSLDYYDGLETVADVVNETLFPALASRRVASAAGSGSSGSGNGNGIGNGNALHSLASEWLERTVDAASTVFADGDGLNLASLMDTNVKASSMFTFGLDFEPTCPNNYETYVVQDFRLGEKNLEKAFVIVLAMLFAIRVLTFVLVAWKIRTRQL